MFAFQINSKRATPNRSFRLWGKVGLVALRVYYVSIAVLFVYVVYIFLAREGAHPPNVLDLISYSDSQSYTEGTAFDGLCCIINLPLVTQM